MRVSANAIGVSIIAGRAACSLVLRIHRRYPIVAVAIAIPAPVHMYPAFGIDTITDESMAFVILRPRREIDGTAALELRRQGVEEGRFAHVIFEEYADTPVIIEIAH